MQIIHIQFLFIWYGIFAVKKEYIINKPLEYYKKLILEVNHNINSTEGHFLSAHSIIFLIIGKV